MTSKLLGVRGGRLGIVGDEAGILLAMHHKASELICRVVCQVRDGRKIRRGQNLQWVC